MCINIQVCETVEISKITLREGAYSVMQGRFKLVDLVAAATANRLGKLRRNYQGKRESEL